MYHIFRYFEGLGAELRLKGWDTRQYVHVGVENNCDRHFSLTPPFPFNLINVSQQKIDGSVNL